MITRRIITLLLFAASGITSLEAQTITPETTAAEIWGLTPTSIKVVGNHLEDTNGRQVMLHGIMDTPSPYFSDYRFTNYQFVNLQSNGDDYVEAAKTYFGQLFDATTHLAKQQTVDFIGKQSWCNVFRLHLDPCWTDNSSISATGFTSSDGKTYDPNGTEVSGEANIIHFDKSRLEKYLTKLFLPIAGKAKAHGMYVILRPPGVCPKTIKVGDYYQQYLINVWDVVTKANNKWVNNNSGWISIELANEPVEILDKNGQNKNSGTTMRDFFQPIVNKIRENGFKGIIWVPGGTWQQEYRAYKRYPITDPLKDTNGSENYGYAVHWYPGWYSTSDDSYDNQRSLNAFLDAVPVAKTHPIMITEVDWSPEDPNGTGHYNEYNQWVKPNCGTWATGTTSKFGKAFKYVIDYLGNCGMTLTHTHDYLDIDYYRGVNRSGTFRKVGFVRPAFTDKLGTDGVAEACSGACFDWYDAYAHSVHKAKEWPAEPVYMFNDDNKVTTAAASLSGRKLVVTDESLSKFFYVSNDMASPQNVATGDVDSEWSGLTYKYLSFQKVTSPGCTTTGNLYTLRFVNSSGTAYTVWGRNDVGYIQTPTSPWCTHALGKSKFSYGEDGNYFALWKVDYEEGKGYVIQNVGCKEAGLNSYLTPSNGTLVSAKTYVQLYTDAKQSTTTAVEGLETHNAEVSIKAIYDASGRRISALKHGLNIIRMSDGTTRKIMR